MSTMFLVEATAKNLPGRRRCVMPKTRDGVIAIGALVAFFWPASVKGGPPEGPALETLLEQAGQYAKTYEHQMSEVGAEEIYTQKLFAQRNTHLLTRKILSSDLVITRQGGDLDWAIYRDVFSVDDKPVRSRDSRLEK